MERICEGYQQKRMSAYHTAVLVSQVLEGLDVKVGKRYIDATLGGGGHTQAILNREAEVLAIDEDSDAIEQGNSIKSPLLRIVQGNFRNIEQIARKEKFEQVDGVLFDLGVSSHQIDDPRKGFSFRFEDAPLDMRFGQKEIVRAEEILAKASQDELYEIFAKYGEEERAWAIAARVVRARQMKPIKTAGQLRAIIEEIVGTGKSSERIIARIFQAIRIAVNEEMQALAEGLEGAYKILKPGGRIAVISFHSLEDRIVKRFFAKKGCAVVHKKPLTADEEEMYENPRSRSAKLRIAAK